MVLEKRMTQLRSNNLLTPDVRSQASIFSPEIDKVYVCGKHSKLESFTEPL